MSSGQQPGIISPHAAPTSARMRSFVPVVHRFGDVSHEAEPEPQSKSGSASSHAVDKFQGPFFGAKPTGESIVLTPSLQRWLQCAEDGELDIFCCLALSNACTLSPDTRTMMSAVCAVIFLQFVVPCFILQMEMQQHEGPPVRDDLSFRLVGCGIYLYSLWTMYANALDECRILFLQFAFEKGMPMGYWWPALLGEIVSSFVSLALAFTLFLIFVQAEDPADHVLNAVAVNFLGNVDVEFVTKNTKAEGILNFRALVPEYLDTEDHMTALEQLGLFFLKLVRVCGTLGLGHVMAFVYLVSGQPFFCENLGAVHLCADA